MKKLRVAAYCRVSTDQDDQRNSLENQKKYFQDLINDHPDWALVQIFADQGITGTSTKKRKEFNKMIALAERGEIDLILTKEVSRFARNTVDTLAYTRKLKESGVGVLFLVDNIDTRENDGEFRLSIMASVAQEESRKTSERVRWGQKRQMERGVVFGNNSLYGFDLKNGKLTIRREEAEVVRHIFRKFVVEGKGTHVIARELFEEGIPPPRTTKGRWSSTMILRILRNEKFCGDLLQKKEITTNYLTHKKVMNNGFEEKIYLRDHHEAIIDRTLFEQAQTELARRARTEEEKSRYSNRHWCSGRIRCADCGSRFVLRIHRRSYCVEYRAWVCHARAHEGNRKVGKHGREVGCNMRVINDKTLRACVMHVLQLLQIDADGIATQLAMAIQNCENHQEMDESLDALRKQHAQLLRKQEGALDAFLSGIMTRDELDRMQTRYRNDLAALDQKISLFEQQQELLLESRADFEALAESLREQVITSEEVWHELVEKIVVHEDRLAIKLFALPQAFVLRYVTSGRGKKYKTEIMSCELEEIENT